MRCYTLDEARSAVVESSAWLIRRIDADPETMRRMILGRSGRGAGALCPADRALVRAHRSFLDGLRASGYGGAVDDELDGICSAVFPEDGGYDPGVILEVAYMRTSSQPAA